MARKKGRGKEFHIKKKRDMAIERSQRYAGRFGLIPYLIDFGKLYLSCKKFREECKLNFSVGIFSRDIWILDLSSSWAEHNMVKTTTLRVGAHARDCGCD